MGNELDDLLNLAKGGVPNTDYASNATQFGSQDDMARMLDMIAAEGTAKPYDPEVMPSGLPPKPNPYGDPGLATGQSFKDVNPHGGMLPSLDDPYANVSKSGKIKVKTSGPNDRPRGKMDPYSPEQGTSKQDKARGMGMITDAAKMGMQGMDMQAEAAEQEADINSREFTEQLVALERRQGAEVDVADKLRERQQAKEEIQAKSYAEATERIAAWEKEAEAAANTEVDPSRYWNKRSGFQKAMYALGAIAGAGAEHIYGKNTAMDMLRQNIVDDMSAQGDQIARKMNFLKDKRGNIDFLANLDRMKIQDFDAGTEAFYKEYTVRLGAMDKDIEAIKLKHGAEKVNPQLLKVQAELQGHKAQIVQGLGNMWYQDAVHRGDQEFQSREAAKNREHSARMARESREFEIAQAERKAAADAAVNGDGTWDTKLMGVFSTTKDKDGNVIKGPGRIKLKGDATMQRDTINRVEAARLKHIGLKALNRVMKNRGTMDTIWSTQDQKAAEAQLVIAVSKEVKGVLSDQDTVRVLESLKGAGTGWGEMLRGGDASSIIDGQIDGNISNANAYFRMMTEGIDGGEVIFDPDGLYNEPGQDNSGAGPDNFLAEAAGKYGVENRARPDEKAEDPADRAEVQNWQSQIDEYARAGDDEGIMSLLETLAQVDAPFKKLKVKGVKQKLVNPRGTMDIYDYATSKLADILIEKYPPPGKSKADRSKKIQDENKGATRGDYLIKRK